MVKTIAKVGNSYGLIFDAALRELTGLRPGDAVNVTLHESGVVVLTPMKPNVEAEEAGKTAKRLIRKNDKLFKRLA